jgi:hypothetical protein
VQLDRLVPRGSGYVAERRGALLQPGVTTVALEPGRYFFKTLSDAHLRVVCGGIDTKLGRDIKDPWPTLEPTAKSIGDDPVGETPTLTIA